MHKGILRLSSIFLIHSAYFCSTFRLIGTNRLRTLFPQSRLYAPTLVAWVKDQPADLQETFGDRFQDSDHKERPKEHMARKTTADPIKDSSTKVSAAKKASPKKKAETPGKSRSGTNSVTQNTKLSAENKAERELKTPRRYKEGSTKQKTRRGKSPEDLEDDVEVMAEKVGIELPEDEKQKEEEVESAIEATSDRPYREYSKQGALEKLKKTHKVTENKAGEGDPFSEAARRAPKSRRGINAPPSKEEKDVPPTKRHTKAGDMSERSKVTNEKNRPLADALYELADFVLHGDAIQKGLSYQKAAKSVREAKQPITSKDVALKLTGVGKSVGDKIEEYVKEGKIQVLEEYRSGKRGK